MAVIKNPVTGNPVINFIAELVSIGPTPVPNKNGTQFRVITYLLKTRGGKSAPRTGFMYESNYQLGKDYLKEGDNLLARAEQTPGYADPIVIVSHLRGGERISHDDFDWNTGEVTLGRTSSVTGATRSVQVDPNLIPVEETEMMGAGASKGNPSKS